MAKGTPTLKLVEKKMYFSVKNHPSLGSVSCFFKHPMSTLPPKQDLKWSYVTYCHVLSIL